jgi:hypothetical protein
MQIIQFLQLLFSCIICNIDIIIESITPTHFDKALVYKNKVGDIIFVTNNCYAGIVFGELNPEFSKLKNKSFKKVHTVVIGKKTRE